MASKLFIEQYIKEWVGDKPEHMPHGGEMEAAIDLVDYCMRRADGEAMSSLLIFQQKEAEAWAEKERIPHVDTP